jgi:hypothetical protein
MSADFCNHVLAAIGLFEVKKGSCQEEEVAADTQLGRKLEATRE